MLGKRLLNRIKNSYRTWVEIDSQAAKKNLEIFRKIVGPKVKIWPVVKSNAYGHGLMAFAKVISGDGVDCFCVDSIVEGLRLRKEGIKKPILVLGPTLGNRLGEAADKNIAVTVSNFDSLKTLVAANKPPKFHIKIDTGMHRQGFYLDDLPRVIKEVQKSKIKNQNVLTGVYTHFASAKDINYPTFTDAQFVRFQKGLKIFEHADFRNITKHCAATGATLIDKKYHLDAVRPGIGLYGLWPSRELEAQLGCEIELEPVLSWRTIIAEVKNLKPGDYVGYDLTERVMRPTKLAILPVGYWHGLPRSLSGIGEVIINGRRARVLGRVSMDMTAVDVAGIKCRPMDTASIIGRDGGAELLATDVAQKSGTTHYEFLTRLNPLIERVVV